MSSKPTRKVAMLGFDAAEFSYISAHLPSLPNFRRALSAGVVRRLDSPAQWMPGSVWPTFYTTSSPGEHGIHHLLQWDRDAMRLRRVAADWMYTEPFWRGLQRRGLKTIAIDVPMTFSPDRGDGIEVSSWGAHDQIVGFNAWPRALKAEIKRRYGAHPMGIEIPVDKSLGERMSVRAKLVAGIAIKSELVRWLLSSRDWDFAIAVFGESHRGGHILWPDGDNGDSTIPPSALLDVYIALDRAVGEVLAAIDLTSTTVVLFALHGMGSNLSQEHFVTPLMDRVNVRFSELEPSLFTPAGPPRQRSAMRFLRENLPPQLQTLIANMVPQHVRDRVVDSSFTSGYDWPHTPGLALRADNNGYLRFNIKGREKLGMLEPGSAPLSRYADLIRDSFLSLRNDAGEPLVDEVFSAAERFPGARADRLPDLIVSWKGHGPASHAESSLGPLDAELDTGRGGNHRTGGFQILLEPGVERACAEPAVDMIDFAASVVRLFDS